MPHAKIKYMPGLKSLLAFTIASAFLGQLQAQVPNWTAPLSGEPTTSTVQIRALGPNIVIRKSSWDTVNYPMTPEITTRAQLVLVNLEGDELNRVDAVQINGRYAAGRTRSIEIQDTTVVVHGITTLPRYQTDSPFSAYVQHVIARYDGDLNLVDSAHYFDYKTDPADVDDWTPLSTAATFDGDTCYALVVYRNFDSIYYVGQGTKLVFGDTTARVATRREHRAFVRIPPYLIADERRRKFISTYDYRFFEIDADDFSITDDAVFLADAAGPDDPFPWTSYPTYAVRVGNTLYIGAGATSYGPRGLPYGNHQVYAYTLNGTYLRQLNVARDTLDWPTSALDNHNMMPATGDRPFAYDGRGNLYAFGQIISDRRWFVAKMDTALTRVEWYREWTYDTDELWEAHSILYHPDYDGVYLAGNRLNVGAPFSTSGRMVLYRLDADGELTSVGGEGPAAPELAFVAPNPSSGPLRLTAAAPRDLARVRLHPVGGGAVRAFAADGGAGAELATGDLAAGAYLAVGLDAGGAPVARQRVVILR